MKTLEFSNDELVKLRDAFSEAVFEQIEFCGNDKSCVTEIDLIELAKSINVLLKLDREVEEVEV